MPSLRAQQVANAAVNSVYYSDIPINFDMAPNSGDLARLTNENAVKQSLENIIFTVIGERLYNSTIGSTVGMRTFELSSFFESQILISNLTVDIEQNEPRVILLNISVNYPDDNSVQVQVYYNIINNLTPQILTVNLQVFH